MSRRPTYSDGALAEAVRSAQSRRGVLRELGLNATSSGAIRSVRRRADALALDHSHFARQGRWSDHELAAAVSEAASWTEVSDRLGVLSSAARVTVRGHATRIGLDTSHLDEPGSCRPDGSPLVPDLGHLPRAGSLLAAAWFTVCGVNVSWPLEPCRYDLVVDRHGARERVQVKTTRVRAGRSWVVSLAPTSGGRAPYAPHEVDAFFVIDGDLQFYLIPFATVGGRQSITLAGYDRLRVGSGRDVGWAIGERRA